MRGVPRKPEAEGELRRARRLAWISIAYILSTIAMLFPIMAGSQALKTELAGELLSLIPPSLFLIGDRISRREPTPHYPFGYERGVSAGYIGAATALLLVGVYLLFDGAMKLAKVEHPTIGGFPIFGQTIWTGWLGIAVLLWSGIPAHFLGRAKKKCAEVLFDKTLAADAAINAADWQSAAAAIIGVIGVGFGLWWADAAAAVLISLEIIHSGWSELRSAVGDVMDRRPQTLDEKKDDPVPDRLTEFLQRQPWVDDVIVRVRERGRELTAEAHVVPKADQVDVNEISDVGKRACELDPRLADVTIAPVKVLPADVAKARQREEA
jgi:cation diffusion facilitator family transporter